MFVDFQKAFNPDKHEYCHLLRVMEKQNGSMYLNAKASITLENKGRVFKTEKGYAMKSQCRLNNQ